MYTAHENTGCSAGRRHRATESREHTGVHYRWLETVMDFTGRDVYKEYKETSSF